jgi:hypothetical protein
MKITLNFSWDLDGLRLEGQNLGPFLIIIFCYCPKHCFRLIEGPAIHWGWSENLLDQAVV